jgi:hypothetical protein
VAENREVKCALRPTRRRGSDRQQAPRNGDADDNASDREIIENHLGRAIVSRDQIAITLRSGDLLDAANSQNDGTTISVPFTGTLPLRKGISHTPSSGQAIDEATRSALLMAIARSRAWVDGIVKDPATDIGTIAKRENLAERHVRFLAPLAYLSPRIIEAIAEGRAPADLTVTRLGRNLPTVGGTGKAARVRLIPQTAPAPKRTVRPPGNILRPGRVLEAANRFARNANWSRPSADLTVSRLVRNLPTVWADQEKQLGFA